MKRLLFLIIIDLLVVSCVSQTLVTEDVIVLGVIRTPFNLQDEYTIYANGNGMVDLRLPADLGSDPEWSPNGKWIVSSTQYQVRNPKDSGIYLMPSDGKQRSLISHHIGGSFYPTWSPDGKRIAYSARDNLKGIYVLDIGCLQQNDQSCNSSPIFLTSSDDYAASDWSPDGQQIAYEKDGNIYVIDTKGIGQPENLTPAMNNCRAPKWSPDGAELVFSCYIPDRFDVFIIKSDGSNLINLTKGMGSNTQPQWSVNGDQIAFISTRDGLGEIIGSADIVRSNAVFLMDSDGGNVVRLSLRDDEDVLWFAWLPYK